MPELLRDWLPQQRWYSGKGRPIHSLAISNTTRLSQRDPTLDHLVVAVDHGDGAERYQLFLSLRTSVPERLDHALVGWAGEIAVLDAAHDQEATRILLSGLAAEWTVEPMTFRRLTDRLETDLPSLMMGAEQSNSSLIYGDRYILKLFRRISPGLNPDLEVTRALADLGCLRIVPPLGYLETMLDGEPTTVAMLQPFLKSASDGWALAVTSVRDLYAEGDLHADEVGGDFAAEAERLGQATAEVHQRMAEALPSGVADADDQAQTLVRMQERLDAALGAVPALRRFEAGLRAAFQAVAEESGPIAVQRIHGDFHLGQVMRTEAGWVLFDFEGEPARPLEQRVALMSPLRDVAGMLRSFDYAARHLLTDHPAEPHLAYRAAEWAERNREAFCDGYALAGGPDPRDGGRLLRAFELDKAVYEVVYETRNRPSWLPIPLGSIERIVA
ncbi:MAG TPA: aminoglycoside phosphotransferase [Mycobacteriales bacterium]|nr:aminoglycoside phosphotransferase [Mycobacteriales bacterium]